MDSIHFLKELLTNRLLLRKFKDEDAREMVNILKDKEVASTTLMLPYPCPLEKSKEIIDGYLNDQKHYKTIRWAITLRNNNKFIGGIRLVPNNRFNSAEIGFWLGKDFWRNGYTFEAAEAVIKFAFGELKLNRLEAHAMTENMSSIKLMEKLGFNQEGYHPDLVIKWDEYKDVITFGLLRKNFIMLNNI